MRMRTRVFGLIALALLLASTASPARADITQTLSIPLTDSNWDPTTGSLTGLDPMVFNKYGGNPAQLLSVDVSATLTTVNTYVMGFTTPATITIAPQAPDVNNPSQMAGPSVGTINPSGTPLSPIPSFNPIQQNGIIGGAGNDLSITKTYGFNAGQTLPQTFSSTFPSNSPFFISPTINGVPHNGPIVTTNVAHFATSNADFSKFLGSGTLSFPYFATGISKFSTSSGNGSGGVTTQAGVTMTIVYHTVPEPSSVVLLGLGAGTVGLLLVRRGRSQRQAEMQA